MRLIGLVWLVLFVSSALPAEAVSLAIQPARLTVSAPWGGEGESELLVANTSAEAAMYTLRADVDLSRLSVAPGSFRLDPGDTQRVTLRYRPGGWGSRRAEIAVVARPFAAGGVPLASGVRYQVQLVATVPWLGAAVRGGWLAGVVTFAMWQWRRQLRLNPVA